MKKVKKFFENGRTMLEMLAVLAIIAIIGIGIMAGINHGLVVYKASVLQTQLPQFKKAIETAYSFHQNKYADINDDINQEKYTSMFGDILGQDACTETGCKTAGGSFSIHPIADGNGFRITFKEMPIKICYEIEDNTRGENRSVLSSGLFMEYACDPDIPDVNFISIERGIYDCPGNLIRFNEHEECHCYTEDATRIGDYCYYKEQTPPKTSTTTTEAIRLTSEAKKTESTMASTSVTYASEIISSNATTVHMTETETQSTSNTQIHETKSETTTNVTTTDSTTTNVTTTDSTTTNMQTTDILTTSSEYISDTTTNNGVANVDGNTNTTSAIYSSDTTTNGTTTNMQTTDISTTSSEYISDTTTNGTTTNMETTDISTTSSEYISDTTTDGTTTYMETTDISTTSSEYISDTTTTNVTTTIPQVTETSIPQSSVKTCNCTGCEICKDENTSSKEFNVSGECNEIDFHEIQVDGKLFFISEEPLSWWDARTACNTNGWQMASSTDLTTARTRELCYQRWGQAGNTDNHLNAGALWLNETTAKKETQAGFDLDRHEFYISFPSNKDCCPAWSSDTLGNPTYSRRYTERNKTRGSVTYDDNGTNKTEEKNIYALCVGTTSSSCARTSSGSGGSSSNKTCTCYEACGCNLNTNQLITGNGLYCSVETIESGPCDCSTACSSSNSQGMN